MNKYFSLPILAFLSVLMLAVAARPIAAASEAWVRTADMATGHKQHTATPLPDGRILVAGGTSFAPANKRAELYES